MTKKKQNILGTILDFLFLDRIGVRLDNQFVKEFPDAKQFFNNKRLKRSGLGLVTGDNLTPYNKYELYTFIKSNMPKKRGTKLEKLEQTK